MKYNFIVLFLTLTISSEILAKTDDFYSDYQNNKYSYEDTNNKVDKKNTSLNSQFKSKKTSDQNQSNKQDKQNFDEDVENGFFNPKFKGQILSELKTDYLKDNKDLVRSDDKKNNTYLNIDAFLQFNLTDNFSIETSWTLRPVNDRLYTSDIYANNNNYIIGNAYDNDFYGKEDYIKRKFHFSDYGIEVKRLSLSYVNSNLAMSFGKIIPSFGSAYKKKRFTGLYGTELPEEYKLTGVLGGTISALLPIGNINFSVFTIDTTDLSNTAIKRIGKNKVKGGAGNTEKLNNYVISYDGKLENLSVGLGFRFLANSEDSQPNEKGYNIYAEYILQAENSITLQPFFEVTYITNFNSTDNRDVMYATSILPLIFENWHIMYTTSYKYDKEKHYKNYTSYINQLSLGYKFNSGIMVDISKIWRKKVYKADDFVLTRNQEKYTERGNGYGVMFSYVYHFSI